MMNFESVTTILQLHIFEVQAF